MNQLTWLHLSDWHQKGQDFDRSVVRDALIRDIRERKRIDASLEHVDFVVFSGDLAFGGIRAEYEAARYHLLDPLMDAVGIERSRLFMVPGNHDLSRDTVIEMLPTELQKPLDSNALVQKWLEASKLTRTLEPFEAYRQFVSEYTQQPTPDFASIVRLDLGGARVALLGLNSAWMSARNKDRHGEVNDYGYTLIGEPQVHAALAQIEDADLRIAVVHHPFDCLADFDRNRTEARLSRECHFILRGHVHKPQVLVMRGTGGDCVIIPAGASYERRIAEDSRYTNGYNWVHLDFAEGNGAVYLRRWSDQRNEWIEDIDSHAGGKFVLDALPKDLGKASLFAKGSAGAIVRIPSPEGFERERSVLKGYLNALIRNNTDLDSGGIKQTKVQVVLPLDEIYVGLQADRDRPDVDRRVMQADLDEIKKNLEREEDPKERERQYQIWAHHWRVIQEALEISGPREDLTEIVQGHRQVVILGDPGSGKTTLVRYLALRLARAVMAEPERLFQPQELWDEKRVWSLPDVGPIRLPILLRVSHYAEARQKDPDLALVDYLPRYFAGLSVPDAHELGPLLQRLMDEGRCMVLLDGLDEIIDPTDRRNIAAAIGQFAAVYRDKGLPDWLARTLTFGPAPAEEKSEARGDSPDENTDVAIQWDKNVPEDVRQELGREIKREQGRRRRGRAVRLAWELLGGARYAHVGNRFVVTSRIAGYHFAGVPGEFEHYTIRRMSFEDIKLFLEKWCPAVERRMAVATDQIQVEQRARREIDGILQAVETTPGVRRMAENPLLLRILAIIHRNEAHLPQRRVELYETASVTLLRDWHLERGTKGAAIDDVKATSLLGPLAFYIHENRASGFLSKGETERILANILARERGERDPEQPSLETREAVRDFLETVREHSGLFVERGEGLYGFMHLTFEEYFTARQLVSSSTRARSQILERLHLPRWREPILLAVGSLSKQFYDDTHDLLRAILEAGSAYEVLLHRDLLFAAGCVGDSVNVASVLRQEIARRLLMLYCDRRVAGRFRLLQHQVKDALLTLCNDQGDAAVEAALAETLTGCDDRTAFSCALDAVDWLEAHTPAVASALAAQSVLGVLPRAQDLLRRVLSRLPVNGNGSAVLTGWDGVRDDPNLARLLAATWRSGWSDALSRSLGIREDALESADHGLASIPIYRTVALAKSLLSHFDDTLMDQRNVEFWDGVSDSLRNVWRVAPFGSSIEVATELLVEAVVGSLENEEVTKEAADNLRGFSLNRFHRQRQDVAGVPGPLQLDQALAQFQNAVGEQEGAVADLDGDEVFQSAGSRLLKGAIAGHTLAATFVAAAGSLGSFRPLPDESTLRDNVQKVQSEIGCALLTLLRSPSNVQQYQEAALFLAFLSLDRFSGLLRTDQYDEGRLSAEAAATIFADLEGADGTRRRWALQALTSIVGRKRVEFTEAQRNLLLGLLDTATDHATPALDILFALAFRDDLLSVCWSILRRANHPLADTVRERLSEIDEIDGDGPIVALLDEGLGDADLRLTALELLRKLSLDSVEAFAQTLLWMSGEDPEVRHLAAIVLAGQNDLFATPRSIVVKAAHERLSGMGMSSWSALRQDMRLVRLLGGLWLHGWDDALTQLWVAQPAVPYVDKHPRKYWHSFRAHPDSEECIVWLLEKAAFGQLLIPTFQGAAARLIELEGDAAQGAPHVDHIVAVQQEMIHNIDALLLQPVTPPLLRFEATILASAIRREAIPSVAANMQAALAVEGGRDGWIALSRLVGQVEFSGFLRSQCPLESDHSLAVWLRDTLAAHDLTPESPPAALANLLCADDANTRAAASLSLLAADLPNLLVAALLESTQSPNDRVRIKGEERLYSVCGNIPTDGSTNAVATLLRFYYEAGARKGGHLGTVSVAAVGSVEHTRPFWLARWLDALSEDILAHKHARQGLQIVRHVSSDVLSFVISILNDATRPLVARRAVADLLGEILRSDQAMQSNASIRSVLATALEDSDTDFRRSAAYALQWAVGQDLRFVIQGLLRAVQTDPDVQTRSQALRSLGRVLHAVRVREVDISKEALFRWLETQTKGDLQTAEALKHVLNVFVVRDAANVEAVLAALSSPDIPGLPEDIAARLRGSEKWDTVVKDARQEWERRGYDLETLPLLMAAIAQIEVFLSAPNRAMANTAACALARLYYGDDDRPARLRELLRDDRLVLRALLDAATDREFWDDDGESGASDHPWAVKQIVGWMEALPPEERAQLIDLMLDDLDKATEGMEARDEEEDDSVLDSYTGWPFRRILTIVLAELSERFTYRAFTRTRDLANVVVLFVRTATDPQSYNTRRFAIRALGNLQQFTERVAGVFFSACQDVGQVYRETRTAVNKFKVFVPGSLEALTGAIRSPSITVAYHAALLFAELGVSRSEDLGRAGRQRVADELVQLLDSPLAERIVYDFSKDSDGKRVGPLYDVIYEALVRVVAGPDAPMSTTVLEQS